MNSQKKRYLAWGLGDSLVQELLSLWHWGIARSLYVDGSPTGKLPELDAIKILWRLPHIGMINY